MDEYRAVMRVDINPILTEVNFHSASGDFYLTGKSVRYEVYLNPDNAIRNGGPHISQTISGADIEIDRTGITDVVVKAGAEAEASFGDPVRASAGMEGSISMNSGIGSIGGTGIFK